MSESPYVDLRLPRAQAEDLFRQTVCAYSIEWVAEQLYSAFPDADQFHKLRDRLNELAPPPKISRDAYLRERLIADLRNALHRHEMRVEELDPGE